MLIKHMSLVDQAHLFVVSQHHSASFNVPIVVENFSRAKSIVDHCVIIAESRHRALKYLVTGPNQLHFVWVGMLGSLPSVPTIW